MRYLAGLRQMMTTTTTTRKRQVDIKKRVRRQMKSMGWWITCGTAALLFILIVVLSRENRVEPSHFFHKNSYMRKKAMGAVNVSEEMSSSSSVTRQLREQISLAKSFVVIAKESSNLQFAWELSAQIRSAQVLLSSAAARRTLPMATGEEEAAIRDMAVLLHQARLLHYDSATMIMRLKAKIQSLEEQRSSLSEKTTKFGQIAAEEVPKGLCCLAVRLTAIWFENSGLRSKTDSRPPRGARFTDNSLHHFCVFTDNILAASVVVNSSAVNSRNQNLIVFHVVTNGANFRAMDAWFSMNDFRGVSVEVINSGDFEWLNASRVPVLKQLQDSETQSYYFSGHDAHGRTPVKYRNPKYLSVLNHLRFYIPDVFPMLKKVVFLDDDVVVQKDLSPLFSLNLNGNVNGAVETCMETFHRYHKYLNYSHPLIREHYDPDACGWAFGMNVFDLVQWRKRNVTQIYHYWQEKNTNRTLWKLGTLPPGLLTFYGLTEPLDPSWHVLGLGYATIDPHLIQKAAVLHFNGNSKPWLKIAIDKYKPIWQRYVDYSHPLLHQCNFH